MGWKHATRVASTMLYLNHQTSCSSLYPSCMAKFETTQHITQCQEVGRETDCHEFINPNITCLDDIFTHRPLLRDTATGYPQNKDKVPGLTWWQSPTKWLAVRHSTGKIGLGQIIVGDGIYRFLIRWVSNCLLNFDYSMLPPIHCTHYPSQKYIFHSWTKDKGYVFKCWRHKNPAECSLSPKNVQYVTHLHGQ